MKLDTWLANLSRAIFLMIAITIVSFITSSLGKDGIEVPYYAGQVLATLFFFFILSFHDIVAREDSKNEKKRKY